MRSLPLLLVVSVLLGVSGCGGDSNESSGDSGQPAQGSSEPQQKLSPEQADALRVWRKYVTPKAEADAAAVGGKVLKLDVEVGKPSNTGKGFKRVLGKAAATIEESGDQSGGTLYRAELRDSGGWHVARELEP